MNLKSTIALCRTAELPSSTIQSTAGRQYLTTLIFAIVWNGFIGGCLYFAYEEIIKIFDDQPIFWIFAIFPFAGAYLFLLAIRETKAWRHYGKTPLTMAPFPGQIGGVVGGHIDFNISYTEALEATVTLSCVKHYRDTSSDENEITYKTLWHDNKVEYTKRSQSGARIDFDFSPEMNLPESTKEGVEKIEWVLEIEIESLTPLLKRQFKIPVKNTSEANIAQTLRYKDHVRNDEKQQLIERHDHPKIDKSTNNHNFIFNAEDNRKFGLALVVVAILTGVFANFIFSSLNHFMPTVTLMMSVMLVLVIIVLICAGLAIATNSIQTSISPTGVTANNKLLGIVFSEEIEAKNIVDLEIRNTESTGDGQSFSASYSIQLLQKTGEHTTLGGGLKGKTHADQVRKKMLDALGSNWAPAALSAEPQVVAPYLQLVPKRMLNVARLLLPFRFVGSLAFPIAFLYDARHFLIRMFSEFEQLI